MAPLTQLRHIPDGKDRPTSGIEIIRQAHPGRYANFIRYLSEKFHLDEKDLAGKQDEVQFLWDTALQGRDMDKAVLFETSLAKDSVRKAMRSDENGVSEEDLDDLVNLLRSRYGRPFHSVESELKSLCPMEIFNEAENGAIEKRRKKAVEEMDENYEFDWKELPFALDDGDMKEKFKLQAGANPQFMSTYFGSARKGFYHEALREKLEEQCRIDADRDWDRFCHDMRLRVARALEPDLKPQEKPRFTPEKVYFTEHGGASFHLLQQAFMDRSTRLLAMPDEYQGLVKGMRQADIKNVVQLPKVREEMELLDRLRERLMSEDYDYLLASEVSRLGNVYPLTKIDTLRSLYSPHTKLIVDACQSAGRFKHDMRACNADAVILSTGKGGHLGFGGGALALADESFSSPVLQAEGTRDALKMAQTAYSLSPRGLNTLPSDDPFLDVEDKQRAIRITADRFLELIRAINQNYDGRIEVLNPVNTDRLGHVIELKVRGVERSVLVNEAAAYGVYLESDYGSSNEETIRVAFHPYMNNRSLKILGYVIEECLENPEGPSRDLIY